MPRYRHSQFADFNCFFITTSIFNKEEHLFLDEEICKIILNNFTFYNKKYNAKLLYSKKFVKLY